MAKRFGRNQKRKMREEIKRLVSWQEGAAHNLRSTEKKLHDLEHNVEEWNADTRSILGEYSAFLSEPTQLEVKEFLHRFSIQPRVRATYSPIGDEYDSIPQSITFRDVVLDLFDGMAEEDHQKLAMLMRLTQRRGNKVVYCTGSSTDMPRLRLLRDERELMEMLIYVARDMTKNMFKYEKEQDALVR